MTTELKPGIDQTIQEVASQVYSQLRDELDDNRPHLRNVCISASVAMIENFEKRGVTVLIRSSYSTRLFPPIHATCFIPDEEGNGTVIDLTWQQFLPKPADHLPRVLVCKRSDLAATLTDLGVPVDKQHYWLNAT